MAQQQKIYLTDCGTGAPENLTAEAVAALETASFFVGPAWLAESLQLHGKKTVTAQSPEEILKAVSSSEENVAVLMPGGPSWTARASSLQSELGTRAVLIGGVSPVSVLLSRIGIPETDVRCLSDQKISQAELSYAVSRSRYTGIVSGQNMPAAEILGTLAASELGSLEAWCASHLGREEETVRHGPVAELKDMQYPPDTTLLFSNPDWARYTTIGLPDESFFRGTVPMTKFEVRNIAASKLEVCATDIIYDVGGGTGSVSIELARRAYDGRVYAIERLPEALYLLNKNRRHLRAFNMEIVGGEAPEAFDALPAPDKVFIGGSGGRIDEIIRAVLSLSPRALICATAATLETLAAARKAFSDCRCHLEVIQVSAARLVPRGAGFSMFEAINPVFVLVGRPA